MTVFERFDDVHHLPLRVFNRVVYMNNLFNDFGRESTQDYIEMFDEGEKRQMYMIGILIKEKGLDAVRHQVTKGLEIVENEVYN